MPCSHRRWLPILVVSYKHHWSGDSMRRSSASEGRRAPGLSCHQPSRSFSCTCGGLFDVSCVLWFACLCFLMTLLVFVGVLGGFLSVPSCFLLSFPCLCCPFLVLRCPVLSFSSFVLFRVAKQRPNKAQTEWLQVCTDKSTVMVSTAE